MKFSKYFKFRRSKFTSQSLLSKRVKVSVNSENFNPITHDLVFDWASNTIHGQKKEVTIAVAANIVGPYTLDKEKKLRRYTIPIPDNSIEGRYLATFDFSGLDLGIQRWDGTISRIYVRMPPQPSHFLECNPPSPSLHFSDGTITPGAAYPPTRTAQAQSPTITPLKLSETSTDPSEMVEMHQLATGYTHSSRLYPHTYYA